jgi:cytochrome c7-like protein
VKTIAALAGAIVLATITGATAQQPSAQYKGIEENLPQQVSPQPVPFSHKQHVSAGSECKDCHPKAFTHDYAGLPRASTCMICHQAVKKDSPHIRKLTELAPDGGKVKWVRVYRVPDFVFFSHKNHIGAEEKCETCHGPVAERTVLAKEVSTSMTACMNCHQQREVSNDCHFCHALGF